jgi:hypothetical protein
MLGPHNSYEPSIVVDLRSDFEAILETQGVSGMTKTFKEIKLRIYSTFWSTDENPGDELVGGEKVESFEHL